MRRFLLAMGAAALLACGEEEAAEPEEPTAASEPSAEELPVAEDFAAEAEEEITEDNYRDELAEIEAGLQVE